MRRTLPLLLTATLLFAACGSDDNATADTNASDTSSSGSTATNDTSAPDDTSDTGSVVPPPPLPVVDVPEVEVPGEIPTELVVTVLDEGSGPAAEVGDTIFIDYVGVRTEDGMRFDNSYEPRQPGTPAVPFDFVLGQGAVIPGWDEGLLGAQTGANIQLDIPSDLAYGAEPRGEIIRADEALTFLLEVRAVIKPTDPAQAPTEAGVPASEGATETTSTDLVEGEGDELQAGQTAIINYVLFRGDNQVALESSWEAAPVPVPTAEGGFPGFVKGLPGMKVGGRRAIVIPPADAFGPDGNPQLGLPAGTDMIILVELLGFFGQPTS
jgi:FKBP-type peptidyl-prolyl cis-trans isomerase